MSGPINYLLAWWVRGRVVVVGAHPVDLLALCRRWLVDSHVSIGSLCSTYFREKTSVLSYDSTVLVLPSAHADAVGKQACGDNDGLSLCAGTIIR